jgi:hypothetical protein
MRLRSRRYFPAKVLFCRSVRILPES